MKKVLFIIVLLIANINLSAQLLSVFDADTSNFPIMKAKFYAIDENGKQIKNLNRNDFKVIENGIERKVVSVSCPNSELPALSSVLVFDVSNSMSSGPPRIQSAMNAANAWVNGLPTPNSECALVSFDHKSTLLQDFTTDRNKIKNSIAKLTPNGGTDYNQALIDMPCGGLRVAKNGKYKRIVVFLTDGLATLKDQQELINFANQYNIVIYAVTLDMPAPQCIKDITKGTGGQYFENITTIDEAEKIYLKLLQLATNVNTCEIEWESELSCKTENSYAEIKLIPYNVSDNITYTPSISSLAGLKFEPKTIKFEYPNLNEYAPEQKVKVTAVNSDFSISNIKGNNAGFNISPKNFNLKEGESIELTITFFPTDSGYNYCSFEFESSPCNIKYYASGGWKGIKPTVKTIKLLYPNGGEVFAAGSDIVITWEGVSTEEFVKIEYSINMGANWTTIADSVSGLSYKWRIPNTPSNECLARVTSSIKTVPEQLEVKICNQIWMIKNLDVDTYRNGEPIRYCRDYQDFIDANNNKEGAWCYYNKSDSLGAIYGRLYNWYAVVDSRGLAPEGWHVASDDEWQALEMCLGMTEIEANSPYFRGTDQGSQLAGQENLWINGQLKNNQFGSSGFTALPGGKWGSNYDQFTLLGQSGFWWTSSDGNETSTFGREINRNKSSVNRLPDLKNNFFSVRCVQD